MLKQLRLQNIILVEQADIPFSPGLNILTGETGAGKSAIMKGLGLAVGERSDGSMIRKGCDKGTVEAVFDVENHPFLIQLLEESGIDHEHNQDLIIRREISVSGKNRLFINNQLAQLTLLRKIGLNLAQMVGQHANQQLFSIEHHREILDLFGGIDPLLKDFRVSYEKENRLQKELETLINQEAQRLREIDMCQKELEELEEAHLKEGEDEELFAEYTLMINSKELSEQLQEINQSLSGDRQPIISALHRNKSVLDSLARIDPVFIETAQTFQNALLELQEISHTLRRYQGSIQDDPNRLDKINDRLTLINKLKRKYGTHIQEINHYYQETQKKLETLENADTRIEELKEELQVLEAATNKLAHELTKARQEASKKLEKGLTEQLRSLNMSKAQFVIRVTEQKRSVIGDDKIEFYLQPNVGEHEIALKDAASGGEVSRVLLAIQSLLAGKAKIPTLIFDEVDANIGGETARIVGEKLQEIGVQHQVICVTHFAQVASMAHHHLQISKQEKEGRTVTEVKRLDAATQPKELQRMLGK